VRLLLATAGSATAGLLVQRLPGATDDDDATWARAQHALAAAAAAPLLAARTAGDAITSAFPEEDIRMFAAKPVTFGCSCSRERVEYALRVAGSAEVEAILAERSDVEVCCEFCNRRYSLAPAEARALFTPGH